MLERFFNVAVVTAALVVLLGSESTTPPLADASSPIVPTAPIPTAAPKVETAPIPNSVPAATPIVQPAIAKPVVEPAEAKAVPTSLRGDCANGRCGRPAASKAKAAAKGSVNVVRGLRGKVRDRDRFRPLRRVFGRRR